MSVSVQEAVRPENVSHPVVVTIKLISPAGEWWEAPTVPLINEIVKRLAEPIRLEGLLPGLRLDEVTVHAHESRVLFA